MFLFPFGRKQERGWKEIILNFSYWSELVSENFLKYSGRFFFVIHLSVNLLVTASCKKKLLYQNIDKIDKNMLWQFKQKKRFYIYFRFRAEKMAQRAVRALAFRQCGPGSNPCNNAIRGWSLMLVLSFAPRGLSAGDSGFPISLTVSLPESLIEFCKVTLTFESVDEILWCDHSN